MIRTRALELLFSCLLAGLAPAQFTTLASYTSDGFFATGPSDSPSVADGGQLIVFGSDASNLVPGDTGHHDVFLRDRLSFTTTRVSVDPSGGQANGSSDHPRISADGRFVVFECRASNLVPGDTNGVRDVMVRDLQTGVTTRVSVASSGVEGDRASRWPSISADGRFVAFVSEAASLVSADTNLEADVFVHDRQSGTTERVSVDSAGVEADGASDSTSISADGRYVAFHSAATNLVAGDTNGRVDSFVHDRQTGVTERVSVDSGGVQGNADSPYPQISGDGRCAAFESTATNLVPSDTSPIRDIFLRDRVLATTELVSSSSAGVGGNLASSGCSISADGTYVAFESDAQNLATADTSGVRDVFLKNRRTGVTQRISNAQEGFDPDGASGDTRISPDGRYVVFSSLATNLIVGDNNGQRDAYIRDRGVASAPFCFGDGNPLQCPCGNNGTPLHGCDNSESTGGAVLTSSGLAERPLDTFVLTSSGQRASSLSIVLQGHRRVNVLLHSGDGLLCTAGYLERLYVKQAVGGLVTAPQSGDPTISARSAALGDPIEPGSQRVYQVYYRDANAAFCPSPQGSTWNLSSGLIVVWDI